MTDHKQYYWLTAHDEDGKPYLIYGGLNEDEAREKGLEMLGGIDFEIVRLPTRQLAKASSLYRGSRLEGTHSLQVAARRQGHEKSVVHLRRKMARRYR